MDRPSTFPSEYAPFVAEQLWPYLRQVLRQVAGQMERHGTPHEACLYETNFDEEEVPIRYEVTNRRLNYELVDLDLDDRETEEGTILRANIWVEESPLEEEAE